MTTLRVEREERDGWVQLQVFGDLDLGTGGKVREAVREAVATGSRRVLVDLGGVRFCDSTGVGVLIAARRLLRSCGGELRLVLPRDERTEGAIPSQVQRVFTALGVHRLFTVETAESARVLGAAEPERPAGAAGAAEDDRGL